MSPGVAEVSPSIGGIGLRGAAPLVNVHPQPERNREYSERSQDTTSTFSEGSSGVDYEGDRWESTGPMSPKSGSASDPGQLNSIANRNRNSMCSSDSFQSSDQYSGSSENKRGTWYQKRLPSRDVMDDAVEYRVSRVSGPLRPMSQNVDWDSNSGNNVPGRPRLVEFTKEKRIESSRHGSREVALA